MLGGCATYRSYFGSRQTALLLPTTGEGASIGQNMARAASLVLPATPDQPRAQVYDTADTVDGARLAARKALDEGARILFGPLRADQTPAVLAEAGKIPVVTFSNDDRLASEGAFVMGLTPAQSVATVFSYARAEGVERVALVARTGPLGTASADAARRLAAAGGLQLTAVLLRDEAAGTAAALRDASGGTMPEAVFLPDGGSALLGFAEALSGSGVQLMGGVQWGVLDLAAQGVLAGSWFAAPPPEPFVQFLDTFEARFGEGAGVVTGLGHDAEMVAALLGQSGQLGRDGLTRKEGFTGVLGPFHFLPDGRCQRDLAVLSIENGGLVTLAEVTGT